MPLAYIFLMMKKTSSWHYEVCLQPVADSIRNGNFFSWIFCSFHSMKLGDVLCEILIISKKGYGQSIWIFVYNILWEKYSVTFCFCETLVTMQLITSCFTHLIAKSTCWESLKKWHNFRIFEDFFMTINYKILLVFPKDYPINSSNLQYTSPSILVIVRK